MLRICLLPFIVAFAKEKYNFIFGISYVFPSIPFSAIIRFVYMENGGEKISLETRFSAGLS